MYIILKENDLYSITCDNNHLRVDTVRITCDMTSTSSDRYSIEIPYRRLWEYGVNLRFIEDLTGENTVLWILGDPYIYNHKLKIDFDFAFKEDTTYEFFVTADDRPEELIFRGKIFYTKQKDTQNYRVGGEDGGSIQGNSIYNY